MPFIYEVVFLWDFCGLRHPDSPSIIMPSKQNSFSFRSIHHNAMYHRNYYAYVEFIIHWWWFYLLNKQTNKHSKHQKNPQGKRSQEPLKYSNCMVLCTDAICWKNQRKTKLLFCFIKLKPTSSESSSVIYNNLACWECHISWWQCGNSLGYLLLHLRLRIIFCDINIHLWSTE